MASTFECRIESEALDAISRHQLKVDLQGKQITDWISYHCKSEKKHSNDKFRIVCVF